MNIKMLKAPLVLAVMAGVFAGPAFAQNSPAWNDNGVCTLASLQGRFGYTSTGTLLLSYVPPPFAGPFAEVGAQSFDGRGNTKATATIDSNGNITQNAAITGTYSVKPDCTGSMTLYVAVFNATVHADFVIDQHGTEVRVVSTDPGVIESRVYRKQSGWDR